MGEFISRLRNESHNLLFLSITYIVLSLIKVLLAKLIGPETLNVIDNWLFAQIAIFFVWLIYISKSYLNFIVFTITYLLVIAGSIYLSFVVWLEIGLPY